jgi:hypothetical protein
LPLPVSKASRLTLFWQVKPIEPRKKDPGKPGRLTYQLLRAASI